MKGCNIGPGRRPLAYLLYSHYGKPGLCINIHQSSLSCTNWVQRHAWSCDLIGCRRLVMC